MLLNGKPHQKKRKENQITHTYTHNQTKTKHKKVTKYYEQLNRNQTSTPQN